MALTSSIIGKTGYNASNSLSVCIYEPVKNLCIFLIRSKAEAKSKKTTTTHILSKSSLNY